MGRYCTLEKSNGEIHRGEGFSFIEWTSGEVGSTSRELHDEPKVGYSCIIDPQYGYSFTWITTPITEIVSDDIIEKKRCITFKTRKSLYKLYITLPDGE